MSDKQEPSHKHVTQLTADWMTQLEEAPFVPEHGEHLGHLPNGTDLVPNHLFPSSCCIGCGRKEKFKQSQSVWPEAKNPEKLLVLFYRNYAYCVGGSFGSNLKKRHYYCKYFFQVQATFSLALYEDSFTQNPHCFLVFERNTAFSKLINIAKELLFEFLVVICTSKYLVAWKT